MFAAAQPRRERPAGRRAAAIGLLAMALATATPATASPTIHLGQGDSIAIDQPRAMFEMIDPLTGDVAGPQWPQPGLLDTGANGVLLIEMAYLDFDGWSPTIDPDLYRRERRDDDEVVQYRELGVAGYVYLDVHEPYDLRVAGLSEFAHDHTVPGVRALGKHDLAIAGLPAIIGMVAMIDQRTTLDMTRLIDPGDYYFGIPYIDANIAPLPADPDATPAPGPTEHRFNVPLDMWLPPHNEPIEPGDPTPTFAPMPFVNNVILEANGQQTSRNLLLDTGAQLSILSYDTAIAMGIDPVEDAEDFVTLGGISEEMVTAPLVRIDKFILPTEEGPGLSVDGLYVALHDIGEDLIDLDGLIGMNILTSGYAEAVIELLGGLDFDWPSDPEDFPVGDAAGMFRQAHFEFAGWEEEDAWGRMVLDVNPAWGGFDPLIGDMNLDGAVNTGDVAAFVLGLTDPEAYRELYGVSPALFGDANRDGALNTADVAAFVQRLVAGQSAVPEPGSATLLAGAALFLLGRRQRRAVDIRA